ncbi:MAG: glycosyltransferase family 4 protein [Planctomycetes bacterium]|nr:glycosyltransferase family 4 protein [Planctomycetota bacterium]MBU4399729.1 glycosyltransferase family 4 protein [Planctomycetota bacterium]MCG2682841.1 glycosyltransferase family 4 protein [Planctomycetales bacterium]
MRILLLTQWYPPEPQKWRSDLSEMLQALGHDVTVLTGFPNYPSGNLYPGYRVRAWQRETIGGVRIIRVPLYPDHSTSSLKRSVNYLSFTAAASVLGPFLIPRPDIVYVFSPPLTLACPGWLLSRLFRVPLACEIQDMWPETLEATGMLHNRRILRGMDRFGNWFYRRCRAIRVISPGFRRNLIGKGVAAEKIHCIPNWVDTEFYHPREYDRDLAEELQLAGRFNVMYAGTIGRAQGIEVALDAAELLRDLPDVQFVLVGDGTDLAALQEAARERGLTNVKFLGRHPESLMSRLLSLADVLLVHLRDEPLFRITIPHKIYTYMAVGKPILAAVEGDAAATIEASRAGWTCPPGRAEAMAAAVRRLRALSPDERNAMGQNGRRTACETFHRETLVRQIAEMLKSVAA